MKYLKAIVKRVLFEPCEWIFFYFFQPDRFMKNIEVLKATSQYRNFLLRLILPVFLIPYILLLALNIPFILSHPSNLLLILVQIVVGTLLGVMIGMVWDVLSGIPVYVGGGIWLGFWLGLSMVSTWGLGLCIAISTLGGIALGIKDIGKYKQNAVEQFLLSIEELDTKTTQASKRSASWVSGVKVFIDNLEEFLGYFTFAFAGGIGTQIEEQNTKRIGAIITIGIGIGALAGIIAAIIGSILNVDIGAGIWLGIAIGTFAGVLGGIAIALFEDRITVVTVCLGSGTVVGASINWNAGIRSNVLIFVISIVPAIAASLAWLNGMNLGAKEVRKSNVNSKSTFVLYMLVGIIIGFVIGIGAGYGASFVFIISFILSSYRLPLYLAGLVSMLKVLRATNKRPSQVFVYLQESSLHWREQVAFPLPFLGHIMLIAAKKNAEFTLNEMHYIAEEKSLQILVAYVGLLEIVFRDLEGLKNLRDIADLTPFLSTFMQNELGLLPATWQPRFSFLYEASRDASRYRNSLSWQIRYDALTSMITNLRRISFKKSSSASTANDLPIVRLETEVNKWLDRAGAKLKELEQEYHSTELINNPYVVGPVLVKETSPFVGRRDIAQQLERELRRGSHRPTFFLSGERRMGKSSLLRQLPRLLDDQTFLPIFYNLQNPSARSSAVSFLGNIAEEIQRALNAKEKRVETLERSHLQEASLRNEAEVYFSFDEWLKKIELMLEIEDLVLLLSFDEFEALFENPEKEDRTRLINLSLLLSWFRSVIQDRPRLALLFSGGRTIDEISNEAGINWTSYFVNVQTLKVGFLKKNEARQLITQPIPISDYDYPIEQIFGDGVVDEIIRITGCHPFLVQAVCSELVFYLNGENRVRAEIKDMKFVVDRVLEKFQAFYFGDLWGRTDPHQRACLIAIKNLGEGELFEIVQQNGLDEKTTRRTLQTLLKRDLIVLENSIYRMVAPIFTEWVEQNS